MRRALIQDYLVHLAGSDLLPHRFRPLLLRRAGIWVGDRTLLMAGLRVARTGGVHIGSDVFINFDCYIDAEASVVIEDRVQIADHVRLVTSGHDINTSQSRAGESWGKPIRIGAGSWICSSVTVLPGVTIGHGCVVAAGAVVVSDCEPNGLYMGVPAVRKRGFEGASLGSERTLRYEPPPKPWRHAL